MLPIVHSILGEDFSPEIYNNLAQSAIYPTHDARSLVAALAAESTVQKYTIDVLRTGGYPDGLNQNHGHHESFVLINTVSGKTLNNAKLAAAHPHVQAFCVDLWFLRDIAEKLYPDDEQKRKQYLHALVAYQVATYYTLANGKQLIAIEK